METKDISANFKPNWKLTLFYLLLLPLLVGLGFWQLYRADYKQGLQDLYDQRATAAAVSLSQLHADLDMEYISVKLQGRFDNRHIFLLDNRVYQGRPGYEVIAAFQLEPAVMLADNVKVERVWVNRGWVPMAANRSILSAIQPVEGLQTINGQMRSPADSFILAEQPMTDHWPQIIQRIDLTAINERLNEQLTLPYLLRLSAGEPGSFKVYWQPINSTAQKSLGYAVQWFLMAVVLTGLFFWAAFKTTDE